MRNTLICAFLACGILAGNGNAQEKQEPTTVTIGERIVTGLGVKLIWDLATADFAAVAFGYATPDPDAELAWKHGRGNEAWAYDLDGDSFGSATAMAASFRYFDLLDPRGFSKGKYNNGCWIWKNGHVVNEDGTPPPQGSKAVNALYDLDHMPIGVNKARTEVTGGTKAQFGQRGIRDVIFHGGAEYDGLAQRWVAWDIPKIGENETLESFYTWEEPTYGIPSLRQLSNEAEQDTHIDATPYLVDALNNAATFFENGYGYYEPIELIVPFDNPVPLYDEGNNLIPWYGATLIMYPDSDEIVLVNNVTIAKGTFNNGTLGSFAADDDDYYVVGAQYDPTDPNSVINATLRADGNATGVSYTAGNVKVVEKCSTSNAKYRCRAIKAAGGFATLFDNQPTHSTEDVFTPALPTPISDFVDVANGNRLRVEVRAASGNRYGGFFLYKIDQLQWILLP